MKKILILLLLSIQLFASLVSTSILNIDKEGSSATIKINKIDIGMSGFIVKQISPEHSVIVSNLVVSSFDKDTQIATIKLTKYTDLYNDALPQLKQTVEIGDKVILAFGYSRALLIAPSEDIYYRIKKSVNLQWIHPDIFATILSANGHPTPLQEDFIYFSKSTSVGLFFIYLNQKLYTLDALSFKILNISDTPLIQKDIKLPFYTRVKEIEANWFGEGKERLKEYETHYYKLLIKNNKSNTKLFNIIKNLDKKYHHLLEDFEIKG